MARQKKKKRRGMPSWLYWLKREQKAKEREHGQYMEAGKTALALARAIRRIQQRITAFIEPIMDFVAGLKTAAARLIWSHEPWTPQDRTRYNWGKKKELEELWAQYPDGVVPQDPERAARDARRKTRARRIDRAKVMDRVLDQMLAELREDETAAVTSSLGRGYRRVYEDIYKELEDERRAIDADRAGSSRVADIRDYTAKGNPRRTAPETRIPRNMPRLGSYGESVVFGAPSPDQVKAVLNAKFEGKDFSERIWKDTDKLAVEIKEAMTAAIINGENSRIVARRIADRMGVHYAHAERLVRTEMNRILNQAALDSMGDAGAESYVFVAIEDSRTCGRCRKLNRKKFKVRDKKIGVNCPPIHPRCRCTIMAHFEWMGDPDNVPDAPKPSGMGGSQKTIEGWLREIQAEDAAMKAQERRQQAALGMQKRAIQQGKPATTNKGRELPDSRTKQDVEVATRSAIHETGEGKADRITTNNGANMEEMVRKIKEEYQAKWTDKEKELIKELVESGRKAKIEDIVYITKTDTESIIWLETGNIKAGLIHIIERHEKELRSKGIEPKGIPQKMADIAKNGDVMEKIDEKGGKRVLLKYQGNLFNIVIGGNGFIVTFFPHRRSKS